MNEQLDVKVLPCPFCGGAPFGNPEKGIIWCPPPNGCGATIDTHGGTEAEAVEKWNRREALGRE